MHRKDRRLRGFTLIEVMMVVATIGLLATMAIPNLIKARQNSHTKACIANLREIDSAKQQWSLENGSTPDTVPSQDDIKPYIGRGDAGTLARVKCPLQYVEAGFAGYQINPVKDLPSCDKRNDTDHPAYLE